MPPTTLILGIGNTLLSDEGVGARAIDYLQANCGALKDVIYVDGGTVSFQLAVEVEQVSRVIVIDAAELNAEPGTVRCFEGEAMDDFVRVSRRTAHEVGLSDIMDMVRLSGCLPARRALIGVQFASTALGEQLTTAVQSALPRVAEEVTAMITRWNESAENADT